MVSAIFLYFYFLAGQFLMIPVNADYKTTDRE